MLTQQQINQFKLKARQRGFSDAEIEAEIRRKQQELQTGGQQAPVAPINNASINNTPVVQNTQMQQPTQPQGSFASTFLKTILDPVVKVGRDAIGSGYTLAGAGVELASRAFDKDNSNRVGDDLINFGLSVMSDEGREAATSDLQSDPFGTKALKVGAKRGATTASYMVPGGKTVKSAAGLGATSGFLDTVGRDDVTVQDLVTGTVTGGIASGGLKYGGQQLVKGINKSAVNVNKLLIKLANPFSEQFDDEIVKLADNYKVDLPVSAQTSSNFVKQTEAIAQKSMFGAGITKRIIKAKEQVDEIVEFTTEQLAKDPDKINVGNVIKEGFEQFETSFNKTKSELYNAVPNTVKKTPAVLDDTQTTLQSIISAKELSAAPNTNVAYYKTIYDNLYNMGDNNLDVYYRGGNKISGDKITGQGISITKRKPIAQDFSARTQGGVVEELVIDSKAKVLSFEKIPNKYKEKLKTGMVIAKGGDILEMQGKDEFQNIVNYARERGYDAVDLSGFLEGAEAELRVLNPKVLTSKASRNPTYEVLKNTRTTVWEKLKNFNDPIATGDRGSLERLYAALSDDLDNTIRNTDENAYTLIKQADEYYGENIAKINSTVGKLIKNSDPEKLIDGLVKPNSETQIKLVKNLVGEEGTKEIQQGFVNKLFTDSVDTRTGNIKLSKLKTQLKKYGDSTISELLEPKQYAKIQEVVQTLDDVEKLQKAISRGAKPAEGSQTAFLWDVARSLGAYTLNPALVVPEVGGRYGLAKLFSSEKGKQFLTSGLGDVTKIPGLDVELSQPLNTLLQRVATLQGVALTQIGEKESVNVVGSPSPIEGENKQEPTQTPNIQEHNNPPTNNTNIPNVEDFANQDTNSIPQTATDPLGGRTKQDIMQQAVMEGATTTDLEEISATIDMLKAQEPKKVEDYAQDTPKQYTADQLYSGIMNAYAAGDEASAKYLEKMYALAIDREERLAKTTKETKPTAQKTAGAAVGQLRTLFGRGNAANVGTDNDLALGGKGGKVSQTAGKAKGAVKEFTDAEFSNDLQIFRNQAEQTLGLFTQAFGAGTPQEAEAQRLLSSIPGPSTPDKVAKAWFDQMELLIMAAGGVPGIEDGQEQ